MNCRIIIVSSLLFLFTVWNGANATVRSVPTPYATIAAAITAAISGDTISLAAGTFVESVTISKSLTVIGVSQQTKIQGSVTISASNVVCKDFRVQGSGTGITANTLSNLTLTNIIAYGNSQFGASLNNISTLSITGSTFSKNTDHGLSIATCTNVTLANVVADSNGSSSYIKAGIQLYAVTGTSVLTNLTARKNALHGLFIYYGSSGVTVNGGTFSNNGVNQNYDGGGIAIDAGTNKTISNITIFGSVTIQGNKTAGIWLTAPGNSDSIKNVVIGQSGTVSVSSHNDAGVIVYGNIHTSTITANFTRGTAAAAGILLLGTNTSGTNSPKNIAINSSTFSGYNPSYPAISLSSNVGHKSSANVSGTGNTFTGYLDAASIETIIYHKPDDAVLGTVTLTNNNPLPVELVSFTASIVSTKIRLHWETATELNNYGFEIERRKMSGNSQQSWTTVGFVGGQGTSHAPHHYSFVDAGASAASYEYRLKQIDQDGQFEYSVSITVETKQNTNVQSQFTVYPNPFNATTVISFQFPETGVGSLKVYDLSGKEMMTLFSGIIFGQSAFTIPLNAGALSSGSYFCVLHHNSTFMVKKILLLK